MRSKSRRTFYKPIFTHRHHPPMLSIVSFIVDIQTEKCSSNILEFIYVLPWPGTLNQYQYTINKKIFSTSTVVGHVLTPSLYLKNYYAT